MMMMTMTIFVCEKEVCLLCAGGECEIFREREVRTLSALLRDSIAPREGRGGEGGYIYIYFSFCLFILRVVDRDFSLCSVPFLSTVIC